MIFVIHIGLIVVDLEYVANSLCSLLSNTRVFAYPFFPRAFSGAKNLISTLLETLFMVIYFICRKEASDAIAVAARSAKHSCEHQYSNQYQYHGWLA